MTARDEPLEPFDDRSEADQAEMRRRLDHVAAAVDVGEFETARAAVADRVGRRRTRKRVGAALGAVAAITLATAGVLTIGGDDPDTLVTSDDVEMPTTDTESTEPTLEMPPPAGQLGIGVGEYVRIVPVLGRRHQSIQGA